MPKFQIPGRLPSLNQSFRVGRYRFGGSRQRQVAKLYVAGYIWEAKVPKFAGAVDVTVRWVEKDRRRDYDNISAGVKVILDALVATERIRGDSQKWVRPVKHEFSIDKKNPRIEVEINEYEDVAGPDVPRTAQVPATVSPVDAHKRVSRKLPRQN